MSSSRLKPTKKTSAKRPSRMGGTRAVLGRLSPVRPWFRGQSPASLKADALAGLTNATIVLPQGVAFAIIAGLPPEYGLFTAIIVTIVAALWGSSRVMVSGPTTAISAVLFASLSGFAFPGSETYIALALVLTFLVGVLQLAAGLAGLGGLIAFISHSVIVGFTAAAAVLIAVSQLGPALGLAAGTGGVLDRLTEIAAGIGAVNASAVIISAATLVSLIISTRVSRRLLAPDPCAEWTVPIAPRRNAAARPLNLSSNKLLNRARSASGKGADMIHPPIKEDSQNQLDGNPCDSGFGRNALRRFRGQFSW